MKYGSSVRILACILKASLVYTANNSEVNHNLIHNMDNIPSMRGSVCFDTFIPLINSIADQAKALSQDCVKTAASKRDLLLIKGRADIMAAVKRIQDSLTNCDSNSDSIGYLQCLQGIVDEDKRILDMIAKRSAEIIKEYANRMKEIDKEENTCLDQVVLEAKRKTDQTFADLKECMANGYWPLSSLTTEKTTTEDMTTDSESDQPSERTGP